MAKNKWVNPKKLSYRERMDRRLERAGLLNYQTQGVSAAEIADRYARAGIKVSGNSNWFKDNYGFEAPEYVTNWNAMRDYQRNPQNYLQGGGQGIKTQLLPTGGKADRPQNVVQVTDPLTGKPMTQLLPTQQGGAITNAQSPYAPLVFAKPEDVQAGNANWTDVSSADRQRMLADPNFYQSGDIAKFNAQQQQQILADPNFKWDNLPWWQRQYYSLSSNPAAMGAVQGTIMGAGNPAGTVLGGALGWAAGVVGYDPSKEFYQQGDDNNKFDMGDFARGAFGLLNWGAEQVEKTIGLGVQAVGSVANPTKYGSLDEVFTKEGYNAGIVVFENMSQQIGGSQEILRQVLTSGNPLDELEKLHKAAPKGSVLEKMLLGAVGYVAKPTDYILGATDKVQVGDQNFLESMAAIRERVAKGEDARQIMMEMQSGILAQVGDMAGQGLADPLNIAGPVEAKVGEVTARITGDKIAAEGFRGAGGFMDAQQRIRNIVQTPGEALKIDPNYKVSELGPISKMMAGLTKDNKIRAGAFSQQGLLDYTPPKKNLRGMIEYLTNLTPESRARVGQDMLLSNVGRIMASYFNGTDVDGFANWWKAFSNGDMTQAADLSNAMAQSPEFYTVLPAAKNFDIDAQVAKWQAADAPRQTITRIADMLGENPTSMIEDMAKRGTAEQDLQRIVDKLQGQDTPEAKALLREIQEGRFTADILADTVKLFSGGDVPYHPGQWMAETLNAMREHYDNWAVQHFNLDAEAKKTLFRMTAVAKSAQSILLLGANPGYMISNVLPTMVTRAFDGVWGYMTPKAIDDFMARMGFDTDAGFTPNRLDEGVGPGGMVEQTRAATDPIREATRGTGYLTKLENALGQVGRNMPFNKLSRLLEGYEGKQAYLQGIKKFWGESWRRGKAFRQLPKGLLQELQRVAGPRAGDILYNAIEAKMNKAEILNLVSSTRKGIESRTLINTAAQNLNLPAAKAAAMLEEAGFFDALDAGLKNANNETRVRRAFDEAKRTAKRKLDEQAARDAVANIEHIANRMQTEGMKAVTDVILDTVNRDIENWMQHLERMGDVAEQVENIDNPQTRSNLWSLKYAESAAERRRNNAHKASTYLGVLKALGLDTNQTGRAMLANMGDFDRMIDRAYAETRQLRDEHFRKWNNDWDNPRRNVERNQVEAQINKIWADTTKAEIENSRQFGELLGKQYDEAFGIEAGEAARQAWEQITAFRMEMTARRDAFRMSIEGMPSAMRQIESKKFWGETYKYMIVEMQRIKTEAINALDRIANNRRGGDESGAPAQPDPTNPTQPPAAPAVDEMARLRQQAEERQAAAQTRYETIFAAAEPFGYTPRDKHKFIASLNKYGDFEVTSYDDPRLTPEYVADVMQRREAVKAERQAVIERNAAESAVSQIQQDTISRPRNELPEKISNALELEARRIGDIVTGGEPGRRLFDTGGFIGSTKSTYPKWYNDLQASVGGKKKLIAALDKIVQDAGVDKGVVVARVKEFLLANLKYGDAETNQPPNLLVLKDLGADDATLTSAASDFNLTMGTDFTLDQMLAGDYTSAFDDYYSRAYSEADAFDPARWEEDMLNAFEAGDLARLNDLIELLPQDLTGQTYNGLTGETYNEFMSRMWDDTSARMMEEQQRLSIAEAATRSEEAIRTVEAEAETGMTRAKFRESLTEVFRLSDEEAEAVMTLTDARANAYGDANEWYRTRIASVEEAGGIDLAQDYQPRSPKAGVRFLEDGRAIIRAFDGKADVSSIVHEIGHVFRRDLQGPDLSIVENWAGVKDGQWSRAAEEKFARGFERYLADGSAPTPKLRAVFEQFKTWMLEIYRAITGSAIDVEVTPAVKEVFDRLLVGQEMPRQLDQADLLYQMGYDPKAYTFDSSFAVRRKIPFEIKVNRAQAGKTASEFMAGMSDKVSQMQRIPEKPLVQVDDTPAPKRGTPAHELTYAEYKAMLLADQRAFAQERLDAIKRGDLDNTYGPEYIKTETARMQQWLERTTISYERYGDAQQAYKGAVEQALVDELPVREEAKQDYYRMKKSAAQQMQGAGNELFQMAEPTDSPEFRNWFGDSKVVDENGRPLVVKHGSTFDFNSFTWSDKGNPENHFGRAYYFSSSEDDVTSNYAGKGPDLTQKVDREADRILDGYLNDMDNPPAYNSAAYKKLQKKAQTAAEKMYNANAEGKVYSVYVKMENPVYFTRDENATRFYIEVDEDGNETGNGMDLYNSIIETGYEYGVDGREVFNNLVEDGNYFEDGVSAFDIDESLRKDYALLDLTDDNGNNVSSEFIRDVFKNAGYDGFIQDANLYFGQARKAGKAMDGVDYGTYHYIVFDPLQVKAENNRGTWDPTDPNIYYQDADPRLFPDADPRMPLGGYEDAAQWMPQSRALDEVWSEEIAPLLDGMEAEAVRQLNEPALDGAYRDMSPEGQKMLMQYLKGVGEDMASTKMAAQRWGQAKRDQSMLNYNRRTGFDQLFDVGFPYQFFYTRSMMTWAARAIDNPAILSHYARIRKQQDRYENNLPERMRGKMRIDAPWLPDWMGDALYIDPLSTVFTPHNFLRPFEQMVKDQNQQTIEAERILQEWAADGVMPEEQIIEAAKTRSGTTWERAMSEAQIRRESQISNPMDFVSATFGPAWYLTTPAKMLGIGKDGKETVGELPITRTARAVDTVTQDTWAEGIGDVIGLLAKPEESFREANDLPEFGEYGDYYVDRQIANMVADGLITSEDAQIAMIERKGDIFEQARERVKMELAMRVPLMGATYAALNSDDFFSGLGNFAKALPPSLFGAQVLPAGELEYRGMKDEWNDAWKLKDAGDADAITRFFAEHPEYEAYLAKGKEPEDRLRSFLIGQIWDGYMALGTTDRKSATAELGEDFRQSFLDSETRSYDLLNVETLTQWAQMLRKRVPNVEQTLPAIQNPRSIDFMAPEITAITDQYFDQRKHLHPDYYELEQGYYALPKSGRRSYLVEHPELKEYWAWKDAWQNRYPELVPVFKGEVFRRVDTSTWNPLLVQYVADYAYSGEALGPGAYKALEQAWISAGRPRGNVGDWLKLDVVPSMLYGD